MMDEAAVVSLLETSREKHGCIKTVVHASGVLHDGLLRDMESASVRKSFGPKVAGAWYLHKHADQYEERQCIVYSPVSTAFGNPGQDNYAAWNSYLDGLVRLRCSKNLLGVSIQWPEFAEVGMVAVKDGYLNT